MNAKRTGQVSALASPLLQPGEAIELVTAAKVGTPSKKKQILVPVIVAIVTLGTVRMIVVAKGYYIAITSQRLLFFAADRTTGAPGRKLAFQLDRRGLTATPPRRRLGVTCYLVSQQNPDKLRLAFAAWGRRQAETVVSAINTTQPQAPAPTQS